MLPCQHGPLGEMRRLKLQPRQVRLSLAVPAKGTEPIWDRAETAAAQKSPGCFSPLETLRLWEGRGCHPVRHCHLNLGAADSARSS